MATKIRPISANMCRKYSHSVRIASFSPCKSWLWCLTRNSRFFSSWFSVLSRFTSLVRFSNCLFFLQRDRLADSRFDNMRFRFLSSAESVIRFVSSEPELVVVVVVVLSPVWNSDKIPCMSPSVNPVSKTGNWTRSSSDIIRGTSGNWKEVCERNVRGGKGKKCSDEQRYLKTKRGDTWTHPNVNYAGNKGILVQTCRERVRVKSFSLNPCGVELVGPFWLVLMSSSWRIHFPLATREANGIASSKKIKN